MQLFKILKEETKFDVPANLSRYPVLKESIDELKKKKKQDSLSKNIVLKEKWFALKIIFININTEDE